MLLNEALGKRTEELLVERDLTMYKLYKATGVSRSTISGIINGEGTSATLRVIHEICQGLQITIPEFFNSPLFEEDNLEP